MEHVGCRRLREASEVKGKEFLDDEAGEGRFLDVEEGLAAFLCRGGMLKNRELDKV